MKSGQKTATCNGCGKYIKNIPYSEPTLYFGKYAQTKISEINDLGYLEWLIKNVERLRKKERDAIEQQIIKLRKK